jgi:hypothetical protein
MRLQKFLVIWVTKDLSILTVLAGGFLRYARDQ